ncbi:unnamed protein product, partial [Didymodactylos carnosus]
MADPSYDRDHNEQEQPDVESETSENEELSDEIESEENPFITVGICAMSKKVKAKPMEEILNRIERFEFIKINVFPETTILTKPVEEWPICDALISFHSKGFPLAKAQEYCKLRRPFLINDLDKQWDIMDRIQIHEILKAADIPQPRYGFIQQPLPDSSEIVSSNVAVIEQDDQIKINGEIFHKPFVEKPVNAENHEVYIYFPPAAGGGSQRLFRKIGSRSSVYTTRNNIRTDGPYVYEEFMPTDGTDVKVYTVGPEYAHAEARKAPALDGKVERDEFGKEVRYPVILRADEKLISMKICLAFK